MAFRSLARNEKLENALVVDNSVMMRWLFTDGSTSDQNYAKKVLQTIEAETLTVLVPYVWVYESAFVTDFYVKKRALSHTDAASRLDALFETATVIRGEEIPSHLLDFVKLSGVSSYDASYLLLATNQECPLATLDKKMRKACNKLNGLLYK